MIPGGHRPAVTVVREPVFDGSAGPRRHTPGPLAIARQLEAGIGQRLLVARLDEQAGHTRRDDLGNPADGAGDDGRSEGHRLQEHHRDAFVERGQHEDVHRGDHVVDVGPVADEEAVRIHPEAPGAGEQVIPEWAVSGHHEPQAALPPEHQSGGP